MVVIGTFCDDVAEPFNSSYDLKPAEWTVNDLTSAAIVIGMPTYFRCDGEVAYDISDIEL